MKTKNNNLLGIMVCQRKKNLFAEKDYFKQLYKIGEQKNIQVMVFYPNSIDWNKRETKGFQYDPYSKKWELKRFPLPTFVYDRCFYSSSVQYRAYLPFIKRMKQEKEIEFIAHGLFGKWEVHQILSSNPIYKAHIPRTAIYRNTTQLLKWLSVFPIILKPTGGSHGKGIVKVNKNRSSYSVVGRTTQNQKFHESFSNKTDFLSWIQKFLKGKRYLIQQYLDLTTSLNQPYDIRVLVQKNESGQWETTGMAARIGDANNITSNLHGGGSVDSAESMIKREFSSFKAQEIIEQILSLAKTVPAFIEQSHGLLVELGLDVGIDQKGNVWIIEANSKPGRSVFSILCDEKVRLKSVSQPILYTNYLIKKRTLGGNVL